MDTMIAVSELTKNFRIYRKPGDRLREVFLRQQLHRDFTALDAISFTLEKGKTLGVIGENGSGKSTLLKLITGVLLPDAGQIDRYGKITGLLELGTGFNMELSGEQNIFLNGTYLHLTQEQLEERREAIIAFAELDNFIREPLKNYSSGMIMRLAFSIAIHADPQCFIIDEALSVGDVYFQQKCFNKLKTFKNTGGSIIFVSHDMNAVKLLCDEAMLLHKGKMEALGEPDMTVNLYNKLMAGKSDTKDARTTFGGYGNSALVIESAQLLDSGGHPVKVLLSGSGADIVFSCVCRETIQNVSFGFLIRDRFGQDVFGSNGSMLGTLVSVKAGETHTGVFHVDAMNMGPGMYTVTLAAHTGDNHLESCFHWIDNAVAFEILHDGHYLFSGHTRLSATLNVVRAPADTGTCDERM